MSWIEWCKCQRMILTTGQQEDNKPCELCQKEKKHADSFVERLEKEAKDE